MTTRPQNPLAEEYFVDLRRCAGRLPRQQRIELLAELRTHLDDGVDAAQSDADILNMLDALGTPKDIVDASAPPDTTEGPTGRLALAVSVVALILIRRCSSRSFSEPSRSSSGHGPGGRSVQRDGRPGWRPAPSLSVHWPPSSRWRSLRSSSPGGRDGHGAAVHPADSPPGIGATPRDSCVDLGHRRAGTSGCSSLVHGGGRGGADHGDGAGEDGAVAG